MMQTKLIRRATDPKIETFLFFLYFDFKNRSILIVSIFTKSIFMSFVKRV